MAGRDADRLMAEIETYHTSGRAPRPAPEPNHKVRGPRRPPRRRVRRGLRRSWSHPLVRVVAVIVVLAASVSLIRHRGATAADGADHASTAPASPDYSFMRTNPSGSPTRWNPCAPIHYRTNLTEAPPSASAEVSYALQQVASATGLRFVDDGTTTTIPTTQYETVASAHRAPVIIAWATSAQTDLLRQSPPLAALGMVHEVGVGGPGVIIDPVTGHGVYVTGMVVIESQASATLNVGFGTHSIGVVLMHELGHLVGLGHTTATDDIMNPVVQDTKDGTWGPGDLAGLRRLGIASGCLTVPSRHTVTIVY